MKGKRIADDGIYLDGVDLQRPKEIFILLGDLMEPALNEGTKKILDVGCAAGGLVHYIKGRFPQSDVSGMDVSETLIEKARVEISDCDFFLGSVLSPDDFGDRKFDVVTCCGVLSIFDDIEAPLANMIACTRPGGSVMVYTIFNEDPIDVLMRYRRSDEDGDWETGWNVFSMNSVEKALGKYGDDISWNWHPFELPFVMEKKPDPMRTWTIETVKTPHQLVNGACQLINMQVLHIIVNKTPVSAVA